MWLNYDHWIALRITSNCTLPRLSFRSSEKALKYDDRIALTLDNYRR